MCTEKYFYFSVQSSVSSVRGSTVVVSELCHSFRSGSELLTQSCYPLASSRVKASLILDAEGSKFIVPELGQSLVQMEFVEIVCLWLPVAELWADIPTSHSV